MQDRLTKYEKAHVIGIRAEQIANGAPPCVDNIIGMTALEIAEKEFLLNKMPLSIIRQLTNNKTYTIKLYKK